MHKKSETITTTESENRGDPGPNLGPSTYVSSGLRVILNEELFQYYYF